MRQVRTGLRNRVQLLTAGVALRGVKAVGDDLHFGHRLAAVARLPERARKQLRHLLAVDVDLVLIVAATERIARGVLPAAGRENREVEPVTTIDWQVLHLPWVDVAADLRRGRVDERRLARHGDGFLHRRGRELQVDHGLLIDQEIDRACHRGESREQGAPRGFHRAHRGDPNRLVFVAGKVVTAGHVDVRIDQSRHDRSTG